jgi:hypothetical protein
VLAVTVNTPGAAKLTFYFPVGLFIIIATALYPLFSRPQRRVPAYQGPARPRRAPGPTAAEAARYVSVPDGMTGAVPATAADVPGDEPAGDASRAPGGSDAGTERGRKANE